MTRLLRVIIVVAFFLFAYYHGRADRSLLNDFDARVIELGVTKQLYAAERRADNLNVRLSNYGADLGGFSRRLANLKANAPKSYQAAIDVEIKALDMIIRYDGGKE